MPKLNIGDTGLFFDIYGAKLKIEADRVIEKPTLIVLHGAHGLVDHTLYVNFWSQFADIAQVIFLDQRGCGRSDRCDASQWNLNHWGHDVYKFCQTLQIEKPIVAGISMGGHVICEYIKHYPQHPRALIFCHTEAKFDLDAMVDKFTELGGQEIGEVCRKNYTEPTIENLQNFTQRCMPFYAQKNPYTQREINRCLQHTEIFTHYCKNELRQFDYSNDIGKICCPSLFMVGEKSPGHPPRTAAAMANQLRSELVTYHEFKNAGAPVYRDCPEESYRVVYEFLNQFNESS